ncbi:MAG: BrnA antitoxin family protein [Clostridiales Family XIII bacterium]|nr:BrnA antitoxin family protein [Clostridiales Family XIII bacterium]
MKSETDWDRLLSMKEEDIIIDGDSPDVVAGIKSGRMKVRGRPRLQDKKVPISIRLEPDTLESLRALGPGWQTELSNKISDWVRAQHTDAPR